MSAFRTCKDNVLAHVRQNPLTRRTSADLARNLPGWPRDEIDHALRELEREGMVAREVESTSGGATPTRTYWYVIAA
jgi:DNA-binding HxlR family transcriptional regulator